jgi:aryl-alcohol dehydrogenase-like predicted oxidoreductase
MEYRKLGWTNLKLSTIGLGTFAHGGSGWRFSWGAQDDADSIATIGAALDSGISWIDTAAVYGLGHAEEVLGEALKKLGKRPVVATKCARTWDEKGNIIPRMDRGSVRRECEASLRRLGVDAIDLYQIHWPEPDGQLEEGWGAVAELVKEGKVRYAGVSNCSVSQLKRIQPIHRVASLQPPYSMLARGVEDETLAYCAAEQIGVVVYSPMQKGLLTGKVTAQWVANLPEDDHRRRDPRFSEPHLGATLELLEGLRSIAEKNGIAPAQLAIAWVLRRPEVTSAIVGARKPAQLQETISAGGVTLKVDDLENIENLLARHTRRVGQKA